MRREIEIAMTPRQAADPAGWKTAFAHILRISPSRIKRLTPMQRSIDARSQKVKVRLKAEIWIDETPPEKTAGFIKTYTDVSRKMPVIIIGAGPAGLFAALKLIELGLKPVIIERGKDVKARKFDIARINREQVVNPDSNYCFGEGGAGTFSDGKLYTRSSKRGNISEILQTFVAHGANPDILIDAHPHIGTDKLPAIISSMRNYITDAGGEIFFNRRISDIGIKNGKVQWAEDRNGTRYAAAAIILATGHSATDIYDLLHAKGILMEAKSFALGVRAEHPQQLIDEIQYHQYPRDPYLPAAIYSLVKQVEGRGVFSFCMCPGGIIVPSATGERQVVVNGMSNSQRNSPYANSGIVVQIEPADLEQFAGAGPLAGIYFQRMVEEACWQSAGSSQVAPAQRLTDFTRGVTSSSLPACSYHPSTASAPLHELLPASVSSRLREAFLQFDKQMKGYHSSEAILLGTESRTSSPVRIPRNAETLEHVQVAGLFPCGEGAGYSGGIMSSAIDGVNCAAAVARKYKNRL